MLKEIELKKDVEDWVHDFVSVYNDQLEAIPCPYAKHAVINDRIIWKHVDSASELNRVVYAYSRAELWGNKEVLVIGIDPKNIDANTFEYEIERLNNKVLRPAGYIALEDHPNKKEEIAGVKMNQGKWALVLIQTTEKLDNASEILKRQGYYDKWTQEQLDEVVTWRSQ